MGQIGRRTDRRSTALWLALALALTLVPTAPMPAQAQAQETLTVCPSGCVHTTIQAAIDAALDGDVIEVAEGTYTENLVVSAKQLTIRGVNSNPFTIDAGGNGRGLTISNGSVYLLDATITGGVVDGSNDVFDDGGGILVDSGSRLDLQDSLVTGNRAVNGGGIAVRGVSFLSVVTSVINSNIGNFGIGGGGVYAEIGSSLVEFIDSEISDNQMLGTGNGGGLFTAADFSMLRTTVSGNSLPTSGDRVDADGGGIFFEGVAGSIQTSTIHANAAQHRGGGILVSAGSLTIADSTLTANQAGNTGNLIAVPNDAGQASFVRSILAENQPLGENLSPDCSGFGLSSGGYNFLDGVDACSFTLADTDLVNADGANLGLLEDNGGNTRTRLPLSGSPVIDAIPSTSCPTEGVQSVDQRLVTRPQGDGCDIGSVELELVVSDTPLDLVGSIAGPQQACRWDAIGDEITLQVTNQGGTAASGTSFFVGVYLSSDSAITTSDTLLKGGRESVSGTTVIEPGQTINVPLFSGASVPGTVPTGTAYLGLVVDEFNAVAEGDETNNIAAVPITIVDSCSPLFGVESNTDSLSSIDRATGDVTVVGPLDPDPNIFVTPIAMGVHPTTGDLYVWNNSNIGESTGVLLIADRCTGLATPVDSSTGPQGQLSALAFAADGSLFGLDSALYQVDPVSGVKTQVGTSFGEVRIAAADFAPDGTLYGVELAAGSERLYTINTSTGALTQVGTLSTDIGTIGSIVFAPDGTLLGSAGTQLFEIDPVTAAVSGSISLTAFAPQGMGFSAPCEPAGTVVVDSVSVDDTSLEAGYAVPLAEIPPERLVFGATTIAGAPMGAIELDASPMAAIPMAAIPMAAIGGTGSLGQTLLSEIPIDGGWEPLLVGTPYEGRPLQTLTLDEVAGVIDPADLAGLNLGSLTFGNTGLSDLSIASMMLGDVPLSSMCAGCPAESALDIETSGGSLATVPMGAIPMAAIPMGAIGDLQSAPMGAIPMAAIPMGAIPMGAIGDIQANPLGAIPMGAIANLAALPMAAIDVTGIPMGAIPMAAIPMGAIPIGAIGGGCNGLVDCSFPGVDDFTTVDEYLVATGSSDIASSPMGAIPMGAIPMGAIPMGAIPMAAIPMAAIPLSELATTAAPMGAIPMGAIADATGVNGCADPNSSSTCSATTSLKDFAAGYSGSTLEGTPMGAIELGELPMAAIPMAAIDLNAVAIAGVPMAAIEFDSIDLVNSPMGAIPMAAIDPTAICVTPSTATTLLEAAALGELCDDANLGDIDPAVLGGFELGDILNYLTLGFLAQIVEIRPEFGDLTYGELVVSILLAIDFPWEELPLDQIETRDVACGFDAVSRTCAQGDLLTPIDLGEPDIVEIQVDFTVTDGPVVGDVIEVTIPADWGYMPDSAVVDHADGVGGFFTVDIADPSNDGNGLLTFTVPVIGPGSHKLRFMLAPGFELGSGFQVSADEIGGVTPVSLASAISVGEGLEFGDLIGNAVDLEADHLYVGYIRETDDEDWWRVGAPDPGFRVAVYLSNLAGDVDTFVYRPATAPLGKDTSERDIPLAIQPFDDDDVYLGGGGSLSPELLADSPLNQPAGTVLGDASANRGADDEIAEFDSRSGDTGDQYTIQVAGFQDATSESPYVLRVRYREEVPTPACTARTGLGSVGGIAPAIPPNVDTIFLANWDRMTALYPLADVSALRTQLDNLANSSFGGVHVNGVVVPIGSIPGVTDAFAAWDANPCDPAATNAVADPIISYIQGVAAAHPTLRHVAIIGGDEMVPFVRLEDEAIVANESTYTEGFDDNALYGAHFTRHYLSDSPYGDLDPIPWLGRFAYIRDLGVGRLVESPADIAGALTTFTDNGGVLDPQTAATAGYDFLTDGAQEVKTGLSGLTDLDPSNTLLTETWTRQQLADTAYGASAGTAADVVSPNAHYDHYRSLPAIENFNQTENNLFTIDDVNGLGVGHLARRIIFTMGCHSGLSVDDKAGGIINQSDDWAQAYGAQRAVYIGNTGYGYGDTATVALSEQMMANVAAGLGNGQTIGQNLAQAGQDQFGKAGLYGVYDLKAIEEATLYGLPMWRVNVSGASPITGNGSETGPVLPDSQTGLPSASFSKSPTFIQESAPLNADGSSDGTYFTADGGTQFMQWRPITPKTEVNVTQDGLVATGGILTDLVSRDVSGIDAVFARPNTTDQAGREPEIEFPDVIFPNTFATLGTYELLNPGTGDPTIRQQSLNLLAGQYVGPTSTQRLFDRMDGQVYYVPEGTAVDWTPPRIVDVEANVSGGNVGFLVKADDPDSGVSRVVVLYRSSQSGNVSDWTALDLIPLGDGSWAGGGDTTIAQPDFIVQALNGDGVSGTAVFKGDFYQADEILIGDLNQPPSVDPITAPTNPVQLGNLITASALVTDDGSLDTAVWSWGDGNQTVISPPSSTIEASHTYTQPGVYRVRLVVVDDGGLVGESVFEFVVVYDPEGGFVTGGGWIESPAGAYTADTSLAGKAIFGFNSKYQKGKTVPQGNTTFKFHTADLDFRSTEYEWLVISGEHKAQYKGTGTINGSGNYGFILTAIDAEKTASTDTDLFRIKIWDKATDTVVYDNGLGAADDADPTTAIAGGSIVIHSGKNGPS